MKMIIKNQYIITLVFIFSFISNQGISQIRVVNMVPQLQSNQTDHDVETNIAVNPANKLQIVGTAFTPDPLGGPNAPIYISTDGGNNWALNSIIPGNDATYGTGDITVRFAGSGDQLYAGTLRGGSWLTLNILRIPDYTSSTVAELLVNRANVDQPYVQANTVLSGSGVTNDRVYITTNDWNSTPQPAAVNLSLDAFSTSVPAGFSTYFIPNRTSTTRVMPGVRPSIHPLGIIYVAYYNNTASGVDVVVARDDNWGSGTTPFQDLLDGTDGLPGQRIVIGRTLPAFGVNLGNSRLVASNISIAVDPTDAATVYVAWADRVGTTDYTLHVRRSDDSGQNWSADLLTITNATNPSLAVNSAGKVGFMYQQLTGTGTSRRWVVHLRRSTNSGTTWDDVTLSTSLMSDPGNWIGDYDHLLAVGKDFYGTFCASNYPDIANFPQGVTYLRNANWTTHQLLGTDGTTVISVSKDPFFFQVTELPEENDFFIRDFTLSPTNYDPGLEPSTYPWFYTNSDVWNKRSNAPGSFNANNQPESEDPWQTTDGHNYAFARVHRKTTGVAQTVTLHYLISEFGTGSNYVHANTTPDPTVNFGATDVEITTTTGYEWELPVTTSSHTCLAVEISTPDDPIIDPSLFNHAPGWSNGTDLMVLNDNNKAQRNMEVYHVPTGGSGSVSSFAVIHNPSIYETDIIIKWKTDLIPKLKIKPSVFVVNDRDNSRVSANGITLLKMKPGETRYLNISYPIYGNKEGAMFPVGFAETKNDVIVNGFVVAHQYSDIKKVILQNIKYEALIFRRISKLYKNSEAETVRKNDLEFLEKKQLTDEEYVAQLERNLPIIESFLGQLLKKDAHDPFSLKTALNQLETQLKNKKESDVMISHLSLLNAVDAYLTSIQLSKGNTADILQTIYVQKDVISLLKTKRLVDNTSKLLSATDKFIDLMESRSFSIKNYPEYIKEVLPELKTCIEKLDNRIELKRLLDIIEQNLSDAAGLQKEHMNFLLIVRDSINN